MNLAIKIREYLETLVYIAKESNDEWSNPVIRKIIYLVKETITATYDQELELNNRHTISQKADPYQRQRENLISCVIFASIPIIHLFEKWPRSRELFGTPSLFHFQAVRFRSAKTAVEKVAKSANQ